MGPANEVLIPNVVATIMLSTVRQVDTKLDTKTKDFAKRFSQFVILAKTELQREYTHPEFTTPKDPL